VTTFRRLIRFVAPSLLEDTGGLAVLQPVTAQGPPLAPRRKLVSQTATAKLWKAVQRQRGALGLAGLGAFLGLFLVAQWQSQANRPTDTASRPAFTLDTIQRLEAEQTQLKQQISQLRAEDALVQQQESRSASAIARIGDDVAMQRAIAGTVPLSGPGIQILLDDSHSHTLLPSDSPDDYIVHEYQIRDIVNLLWGAGATGIAVNGERFVNSTSVYCVGTTILINDTRTSPPYQIIAVGDVDRLQSAFDDGNALRDLKDRVQAFGIILNIEKTGTFTLPAFDGSIQTQHLALSADGSS
jgi:uncharacterized protein YlxW (UPF0749 family)